MAHKCPHCSYYSEKKYNVVRHIKMVHKSREPDYEPPDPKVESDAPKVESLAPKVESDAPKVESDAPKVESPHKCDHCGKEFTAKRSLSRHISNNRCTGVKNKLECNICHQIMKSKSSLSHHKKICEQKQLTVINNTTNNNNITNNTTNITNNLNINNNNNYITFNIHDSDPIQFNDSHLDNKEILNEIFDKDTFIEVFQEYSYRIFDKLENRIVKKTNMRQNTSEIYDHTLQRWKQIMDNMIYYKLARGVSSSALVLTHKNKVQMDKEYKDTLQQIQIDCELSQDNANKDDQTKYSKDTKNSINMLKSVVKDIS